MMPAAATRSAVPRSGCSAIRPTGTTTISSTTTMSRSDGGSGRWCRYQAHIIGTASFRISEGWKRTTPRSSQRWAPLPMSPATATTASSTSPSAYAAGESMRRKWSGTCASTTISVKPMPMRASWLSHSAVLSPAAL